MTCRAQSYLVNCPIMALIDKKEAIFRLKEGVPVAVPTETVYGLAAPISNESALNKVFSIKKRPFSDPLIVHVNSIRMAEDLITIKNSEDKSDFKLLTEAFWPGPLTLVLNKNTKKISDLITASLPTVAVRFPISDILNEIIEEVGPLAAPSANKFKAVSPTKSSHVNEELEGAYVLEGSPSKVGLESTIYDIANKTVLRPGAITASQISEVLNKKVIYSEQLNTPGSEKDHYQPKQSVWVFESRELLEEEASKPHTLMPLREDPANASQMLYQDLRDCDQKNKPIYILFKPEWREDENWVAFENRLLKASTKWFSS